MCCKCHADLSIVMHRLHLFGGWITRQSVLGGGCFFLNKQTKPTNFAPMNSSENQPKFANHINALSILLLMVCVSLKRDFFLPWLGIPPITWAKTLKYNNPLGFHSSMPPVMDPLHTTFCTFHLSSCKYTECTLVWAWSFAHRNQWDFCCWLPWKVNRVVS